MKKLLFGLIIAFIFSTSSFGQKANENKVKLLCYSTSCCHFVIDIDIWSTTHCFYGSVEKNGNMVGSYSMTLESKNNPKEFVNVDEDIILPEFSSDFGGVLALPKGNYKVVDNKIFYTPIKISSAKKYCLTEHVTGTVLGHDVDYSMTICAYWFFKNGKISKGGMKITPELSFDQLEEVKDNNNKISFSKQTKFKTPDFIYTLDAGDYFLSEDGNIYLENVKLD